MANNKSVAFDISELENLASAFLDTAFSLQGIEQEAEKIIAESNLEQFTSQGVYGEKFGFDKWPDLAQSTLAQKQKLGFGSKQKLERTGALGDRLISPKATVDNNGFRLNMTFIGNHANLIVYLQNRFPMVIVTEPNFEKLGVLALDNFISKFNERLKTKKVRSKK